MMDYSKNKNQAIVVFESQKIRRDWHQDEWWFSVVDVVAVLTEQTDSLKARKYWNKLAQRLRNEGSEVVTNCHQLKLKAPDGKMRKTDCANTEGIFRIIQSIPSPKAEPFNFWYDPQRIQKAHIFYQLCLSFRLVGASCQGVLSGRSWEAGSVE